MKELYSLDVYNSTELPVFPYPERFLASLAALRKSLAA